MALYEQNLVIMTLHAELTQLCLDAESVYTDFVAFDVVGAITPLMKTIKGSNYWYVQYTDFSGKQRQNYIGPDTPDTRNTLDRLADEMGKEALRRRRDLVKALQHSGYYRVSQLADDALLVLKRSGALQSGTVLIGTPAYHAILNSLGFTENPGIMTNDMDVVVDNLQLVLPDNIDLYAELRQWNDKVFPVPPLNLKDESTSFKIRGKDFHIDFLIHGSYVQMGQTASIPKLGIHAQKVPFMDYLTSNPVTTLILTKHGSVVTLPSAARFALHKAAIAASRPPTFTSKQIKDRHQAKTILDVLLIRDPETVREAYDAISIMQEPDRFSTLLNRTLALPEMQDIRTRLDATLKTPLPIYVHGRNSPGF